MLDGTVNGTGGAVYFISANGLLIGSNARFNVGSLGLSTLDATDSDFTDGNDSLHLTASGTQSIRVNSGAQINAISGENSYVTMVAGRIEMGGNVQVNGSAAYVAAQEVTLTINNGLFDIVVGTGTTDANGIVHSGTTGGPASSSAVDHHNIYMVAVPQNSALTALLAGDVGFASSASVQNGQIILSAGYDVVSGASTGTPITTAGGLIFGNPSASDPNQSATPHAAADFLIFGGTYSSDLVGRASNSFAVRNDDWSLYSDVGTYMEDISFTQDVTLIGRSNVEMKAINGRKITVGSEGNDPPVTLILTTGHGQNYHDWSSSGGTATLEGQGYSGVIVHGSATVDVSSFAPGGGTADAGNITVNANSGYIQIDDDLTLLADGAGGSASGGDEGGGGWGGDIYLHAFLDAGDNGGSINVDGALTASASGQGGQLTSGGDGGDGYGGRIRLNAEDGVIEYGSATLTANGTGGAGIDAALSPAGDGGSGGGGYGGRISLENGSSGTIEGGTTTLYAVSTGGGGVDGGDGGAAGHDGEGSASVSVIVHDGYEITPADAYGVFLGDLTIDASAQGGNGGSAQGSGGDGGDGGDAYAGYVSVYASSGTGSLSLGATTIDANAHGGNGGHGSDESDPTLPGAGGNGGDAFGGTVQLGISEYPSSGDEADSEASFASITAHADAEGGDGGNGGGASSGSGHAPGLAGSAGSANLLGAHS